MSVLILAGALQALGEDDNENSTPTAWWTYTGQSYADITNTIKVKNARITDISVDNSAGSSFTVTYVQNTGSYAKQWWWYVGIDAAALELHLSANSARLISLKAYDTGGGNIRFAAAMIANTGADAKQWWYYSGKTTAEINDLVKANNGRLTALESYSSNGQTLYSCILIANKGADDKGWWWYFNASADVIGKAASDNKARLLDTTPAGNGNFNAVMEACTGNCPSWWWYFGLDAFGVLSEAQNYGARPMTVSSYQGCGNGSSTCYVTILIENTPADITACDPSGCISEAKLSAGICDTLKDHVVGYSCEVGGMRPEFGGLARTATNPPSTPMTPDLVTDIASVSKTITATAVLQLLAKDGLTIDSKISKYIYSDWKQGSNVSLITFKELLTHSAGFSQLPDGACGNDITYSALKTIVANGVTASNMGEPLYGNCNFALLRELMPALEGQPLTNIPDGDERAKESSAMYINYVNAQVLRPAGVPPSSCTPPTGSNGILSYTNPAGSTDGDAWGDWSLKCGSGGWVLSGDEIFRVVNDLATGNTLLNNTEKKMMFTDCLGWDCAVRPDCPSPYVCKNGDLTNGAGTNVWTYAGILKCNVPVVVVVNSPLPQPYESSGDIIDVVANALKAAKTPGLAMECP
jgi:hypothetical protein